MVAGRRRSLTGAMAMKTPGTGSGQDEDALLVGREADLERLGTFLDRLPRAGGSLLLSGAPGVGKTALLAAAAAQARGAGMRVLSTTGVEYRVQAGFGALRQLLASHPGSRSHAARRPELAVVLGLRPGPAPGPDEIAEAVVALVAERSRPEPTLLVVDDAQWLDRSSAAVLGRVVRLLPDRSAGLLCAVRAGEGSVFNRAGLASHKICPLGDAASEELLVRRFPALAPQVRRRLMDDAEGNPLALLELPTTLTDSQRSASQALPGRLPLTRRLESAFAARITGMPAAARHVMLVAALEGSGDLHAVRRAVAARSGLAPLAAAEQAGLVHVDAAAGRLGFGHPLMRSAVVELSTSDQRRAVHRALADAWTDVPEQRTWHLAHAAIGPDEEVAALLEDAAGAGARRGDGPGAVAALLLGADLSPSAGERARLLAKAAYVGATMTGTRDVPRLLQDAQQLAPHADSLAAAVATAVYLLGGHGDIDTIHRLLVGAVAAQSEPYDSGDATMLDAVSTLIMVCSYGGRAELWAAVDTALAKFTAAPDCLVLMRAAFGDPVRVSRLDLARLDAAAVASAAAGASSASSAFADLSRSARLGIASVYVDRLDTVEGPVRQIVDRARPGRNTVAAIQAMLVLGHGAWFAGRWDEAERLARGTMELCEEFGYPTLAWPAVFVRACVAGARGDFARVGADADRMERWADSRRALQVRHYASHVRTLAALAEGDFEAAFQFGSTVAPPGTFPPFVRQAAWMVLDLVESAKRTGRREEALSHARAAREAGLAGISPRSAMLVLASEALASEDDTAAEALFRRAAMVAGAERWPFDLARVRLHHGERLRRGKSPSRARVPLTAAKEAFHGLGATPWAARADHELRACGGPGRVLRRSEGSVLTPQQWEIACLAAGGLSNRKIGERLFLSPRTVSSHLYQVFPKLGVTTRAALRDALEPLVE